MFRCAVRPPVDDDDDDGEGAVDTDAAADVPDDTGRSFDRLSLPAGDDTVPLFVGRGAPTVVVSATVVRSEAGGGEGSVRNASMC